MQRTADPVEDHAGDIDGAAVAVEAVHHGGGRGRLAGDVNDEHDRHAEPHGEVGRRGAAVERAVEKTHDALADDELDVVGRRGVGHRQRLRPHGPAVEVDASAPGRRRMEGRIDIVGTDLERADPPALVAEMAQQRQRDQGLAAAGRGGGDDQAEAHAWSRTRRA